MFKESINDNERLTLSHCLALERTAQFSFKLFTLSTFCVLDYANCEYIQFEDDETMGRFNRSTNRLGVDFECCLMISSDAAHVARGQRQIH